MERVLRIWEGDYGKLIEEIECDDSLRFRVSFPDDARTRRYFENNQEAMELLQELDLPGPRLLAVNRERLTFETDHCGEPVEDLIRDLLESDPPRALQLVRETAEHLFDLATANAEQKPVDWPIPLTHARRFVKEGRFAAASEESQLRAETILEMIGGRLSTLSNGGRQLYPQGFANLDPHLRNFVVGSDGQMKMIDFDNFRAYYDPYYSTAFLYGSVDSDPFAKRPTVLQRAVLAGIDWDQREASERFALGLAAAELASLGLEMPRTDITRQQKLELTQKDLVMIGADLSLDWVTVGLEARDELERPELISLDGLDFAAAYDTRPPVTELGH